MTTLKNNPVQLMVQASICQKPREHSMILRMFPMVGGDVLMRYHFIA
jgi:hypothetical protein